MKIKFHGHSCFELIDGDTSVLIDPFLKPNNPAAVATADELAPSHVALTHGHADHVADAIAVITRTGATVTAVVEIATWLGEQGVTNVADPNLGGTVRYEWGSVKYVQAFHTNTLPDGTVIGQAAGLIAEVGGKKVYHLGDTALFSDLQLIAEVNKPDVALVPVGGHYTMDHHDAVHAVKLLGVPVVVPCHYNTFPPIETDVQAFKTEAEAAVPGTRVAILDPGEELEV